MGHPESEEGAQHTPLPDQPDAGCWLSHGPACCCPAASPRSCSWACRKGSPLRASPCGCPGHRGLAKATGGTAGHATHRAAGLGCPPHTGRMTTPLQHVVHGSRSSQRCRTRQKGLCVCVCAGRPAGRGAGALCRSVGKRATSAFQPCVHSPHPPGYPQRSRLRRDGPTLGHSSQLRLVL